MGTWRGRFCNIPFEGREIEQKGGEAAHSETEKKTLGRRKGSSRKHAQGKKGGKRKKGSLRELGEKR